MTKRKTDAEFKKEVYDLVGDEYIFLDTYVNSKTKLRVKHSKCNRTYKVTPSHFLSGSRCSFCYGSTKKSDSQFKQEIYNLVGDEYTFLDEYANTHTKLRVKHNKCGHIYKVRPHDFLRGIRCHYCNGGIKKTNTQFKQDVFDLVGDEYTFLDAYINSSTKIRVKHNKCGYIYKIRPNDFFKGVRCPVCSGFRKNNAQFKQEILDLVGDEYVFLDTYVNNRTKLRVKHNKCGNIYEVKPTDFIDHQTRCPYCNSPKGEVIISKILDTLNVNYESQKTFSDLKDKSYLSYDFYLPDQNILIEYQGLQHYEPIDHFGGDNKFAIQQKHDKLKSDYAKFHSYNLITVPYTEDTFSKIKKYLIKHGLKK